MRIISRKAIKDFYETHPDSEQSLLSWLTEVKNAEWNTPADIRIQYGTASVLKDKIVIFNIGGNKYRLVARVLFQTHVVYVRFIGTHKEYDVLDIEEL